MRRSIPSFTVEVRRASKRAASQKTQSWVTEASPQISELARFSHRAANTPFREMPAEVLTIEAVPPQGAGRILPSLIEEEPTERMLRENAEPEQEAALELPRRRGRPRHSAVRISFPPQSSQPTSELDASLADNRSEAQSPDDVAPIKQTVISRPGPRPDPVAPKICRKPASRKAIATASEHKQVVPSVAGQTVAAEMNIRTSSQSNALEGPARKRTVVGRQAVGDEFKPGERWKRLLRWKR